MWLDESLPVEVLASITNKLTAVELWTFITTVVVFWRQREYIIKSWFSHNGETSRDNITWTHNLRLLVSQIDFDHVLGQQNNFVAYQETGHSMIALNGMGPKMLVSSASTHDQPIIMMQFTMIGNTAIEIGLIADNPDNTYTRANFKDYGIGVASKVTVGSYFGTSLVVCKKSVITVVIKGRTFKVLVQHSPDENELVWKNTRTQPAPYIGSTQVQACFQLPNDVNFRVGMCCWAQAKIHMIGMKYTGAPPAPVPVPPPPPPIPVPVPAPAPAPVPIGLPQHVYAQIQQMAQQHALALAQLQPFDAQANVFWEIVNGLSHGNAFSRLQRLSTLMRFAQGRPINLIWNLMQAMPVNQVVEESEDEGSEGDEDEGSEEDEDEGSEEGEQ
jgi:hypothetical protein